jgi:hypothetical protein
LGIDKKMSKEELIQFEGLVIEIARRAPSRSARCRLRGPWPTRSPS